MPTPSRVRWPARWYRVFPASCRLRSRKAGTGTLSWNFTPDVTVNALFSREHQLGTRPIGFIQGASSGGYMTEAPETIDYYTNTANVSAEYGKKHWDAL